MIGIILSIIGSFVATTLFGYFAHWSLHQKWMGRFCSSHMTHHLIMYPPEDYSSEIYRSAGKDNTVYFFAVASIPMVSAPIILGLLGILQWHLVAAVIFVELSLGALHNYFHDSFHIKNHWINTIPVLGKAFNRWNELHLIHHKNMKVNYGILTFYVDRLVGTYQKLY